MLYYTGILSVKIAWSQMIHDKLAAEVKRLNDSDICMLEDERRHCTVILFRIPVDGNVAMEEILSIYKSAKHLDIAVGMEVYKSYAYNFNLEEGLAEGTMSIKDDTQHLKRIEVSK